MTTSSTPAKAENKLLDVLNKYAVPDPKIVGKLPKGGQQLSFVGHADITKMLIEVDSSWTWEPVAFDTDGLPAYRVENGMAHMAGWLTIHGVRRLGIGSVTHNKPDLLKELASDFLRNAAMRFGICLALWTKQEWEDLNTHPAPAPAPRQTGQASKPAPKTEPAPSAPVDLDTPLTEDQISAFNKACVAAEVSPITVYKQAKVKFGFAKQSDLSALRLAFKEAQANKPTTEGE
jgi:hypothetical protein